MSEREHCEWCFGKAVLTGPGLREDSLSEDVCPVCVGGGFEIIRSRLEYDKELRRYLTKDELKERNKKALKAAMDAIDRVFDEKKERRTK